MTAGALTAGALTAGALTPDGVAAGTLATGARTSVATASVVRSSRWTPVRGSSSIESVTSREALEASANAGSGTLANLPRSGAGAGVDGVFRAGVGAAAEREGAGDLLAPTLRIGLGIALDVEPGRGPALGAGHSVLTTGGALSARGRGIGVT